MKKTEDRSLHWSQQKEKTAGYWQLKFLLGLFRILPVIILRILAFPVGFFYFLFSKKSRAESKRFLEKAAPFIIDAKTAKKCCSPFAALRHIISFSLTLVEKLQSWGGVFPYKNIHYQDDDIKELIQRLETRKGAFLFISHLGNAELLRGLASFHLMEVSKKVTVTIIADTNVSGDFTRMLKELNPLSGMDIINAQEIGPQAAVTIEEKLDSGGLVIIAGDRTSFNKSEEPFMIPFLGEKAPFSPGIFYLAIMMNVPIFFIFALRRGDLSVKPEYNIHIHKSNISFDKEKLSRKERFSQSSSLARSYAELLERYCKKSPFQWYNFFDFWSKGVGDGA